MARPGTPPTPPASPTPPPSPTKPKTPFREARDRAQLRRPPGSRPAPPTAAPHAPHPHPPVGAYFRARLSAVAARGLSAIGLWLSPARRVRAAGALALLSLTPLLGPGPRALALTGGALYLTRLERRFRPPHRGAWSTGSAPALRRTALAELASRWYGRRAPLTPRQGVHLLGRGVVLVGWALGQGADVGSLSLMAGAAPNSGLGRQSLGPHPFPLLAGMGAAETTPTQEIVLIGWLGLGLGAGIRAGAGLGAPLSALLRVSALGLRWGLLLRAAVPLKQALICGALGVGGPTYGLAALGVPVLLALAFGLRDLRALRASPLRALLEAPALAPRGGALARVADALLGTLGLMALALSVGLGVGLFCPTPAAAAGLCW
jgi:hypothetical protein